LQSELWQELKGKIRFYNFLKVKIEKRATVATVVCMYQTTVVIRERLRRQGLVLSHASVQNDANKSGLSYKIPELRAY